MAADDRFANIFTAEVTMTAAQALTFVEMNLGINLRDRIALVIDQLFIYFSSAALAEMTTTGDSMTFALTISDSVTSIADLGDRRILFSQFMIRQDWGTAASAQIVMNPILVEFTPPLIVLPTRLFFGLDSTGLASAAAATLRMHYRTVNVTSDRQIIEVLETLQQGN